MTNIILSSFQISKGIKSIGPKGLLPANSYTKKPLIIQQIENVKSIFGKKKHKIHIIVGYQKEKVLKTLDKYTNTKTLNIIKHKSYEIYGEAKPVSELICSFEKSNVLVVNEGVLFTNLSIPKKTSIYTLPKNKNNFEIGSVIENNKVNYLCYDIPNIWAEITFIQKNDLLHVQNITKDKIQNKINPIFMFEYINYLIDTGITFQPKIMRYNSIKHIKTFKGP